MKKIESVEEFNQSINETNIIALFSADWCPDCRVIEPFLPELEELFDSYTFIFIDRDDFIEVCQEYDIFGIPSFIAFKKGKEVGRFVSKDRKTKEEIIQFIEQLP